MLTGWGSSSSKVAIFDVASNNIHTTVSTGGTTVNSVAWNTDGSVFGIGLANSDMWIQNGTVG